MSILMEIISLIMCEKYEQTFSHFTQFAYIWTTQEIKDNPELASQLTPVNRPQCWEKSFYYCF